jgi:hypothetical protein
VTFLHFLVERHLGRPSAGGLWHCPFHDDTNPSFSVRPPKGDHKIRYKCWGCGAWGDEDDFLKRYLGVKDYEERLHLLEQLRQEYEAQAARRGAAGTRTSIAATAGQVLSSSGSGGCTADAVTGDDPREVGEAWADLSACERADLITALLLMRRVNEHRRGRDRVSFEALAKYCEDTEEWIRRPCSEDAAAASTNGTVGSNGAAVARGTVAGRSPRPPDRGP